MKSIDEQLQDNFSLLCEIIREPLKSQKLKADLSRIEAIIQDEIPDALKKNAPEDFYVLYTDFKAEYDRFRDFILYDKLIGKNVVALGGGFSSGKSSFLNALMGGRKILPEDLDPSTAVPTYIVRGKEHEAHGLNVFDAQITLNLRRGDLRKIAHGFGEVTDDDDRKITDSITLGHVLKSVFFSTPLHGYEHLAFLDTPGYSKPDAAEYSVKTDEQIARGQLNTSNFILWFVPLEKNGTISQTDIDFIRTLREDIPKMVILSQSDKKDISNLRKIIERTKADLNLKGIRYVDVRAFSSRREQVTEPELTRFLDSEREAILAQLNAWDAVQYHTNFAWNFKKLFVRCKSYYEEKINEESRKLSRLNYSLTMLNGDDETIEPLQRMAVEYQREIVLLKSVLETVKRLQDDFFTEIKRVSDEIGIQLIKDRIFVSEERIEIRFLERKSIETLPPDELQNMKRFAIHPGLILLSFFPMSIKINSVPKEFRSAVFENAYFPGNGWGFSNYDKIIFKNCAFHSAAPMFVTSFQSKQFQEFPPFWRFGTFEISCLSFHDVNRIQFEQCVFLNCYGIAVHEWDVQIVSFEGCRFENCWLLYSGNQSEGTPLGALINTQGNNGINIISHSEFVNCGAICSQYNNVTAILSNCICFVRGNRFENCHHYHGTTSIDRKKTDNEKGKKATLFLPGTADEGNTLINSARIS